MAGELTGNKRGGATGRRRGEPMPGAGRPTLFHDAYYELATDYCMLGATNAELAQLFDVSEATIYNWLGKNPRFAQAVRDGREVADAKVARSLYRRAIGYSHPEVHISNFQGEITQTPFTKHYPPDTAAAFIWLQNRKPDKWRRQQPLGSDMTPEEIAIEAQRAIALAMSTEGAPTQLPGTPTEAA